MTLGEQRNTAVVDEEFSAEVVDFQVKPTASSLRTTRGRRRGMI